ncbi:hypothetical protein [Streptomyces sp. NPDC056544]|uniref:hypothetical protein n=1 Tax=unclassified Streptomyces TaxID=2593676 RepID=UPI0036C6CA50
MEQRAPMPGGHRFPPLPYDCPGQAWNLRTQAHRAGFSVRIELAEISVKPFGRPPLAARRV